MVPHSAVVVVARRRRLLSLFKKAGATNPEKAVSVQEICEDWKLVGLRRLRNRIIVRDIGFWHRRGKLKRTEDEKYYLTSI
jgi:hypothetical protein